MGCRFLDFLGIVPIGDGPGTPAWHDMQLIASCSEDTTVKVWGIPEDGFKETETEALITLQGHGRKVTLLRFHPTANNVLAR